MFTFEKIAGLVRNKRPRATNTWKLVMENPREFKKFFQNLSLTQEQELQAALPQLLAEVEKLLAKDAPPASFPEQEEEFTLVEAAVEFPEEYEPEIVDLDEL